VILELDLTEGLAEYVPQDPLVQVLSQGKPTVADTVLALERAARDDRVVALIARVGGGFGYPAKVQELRDVIHDFRGHGKRAIAWVETFGDGYRGTTNYYLATAFDEIHLLPMGSVGLTGLALEAPFVSGALDKLGIEARWDSRREYKNAKNIFTEREFTEPHREALGRIAESQFERIAADVAAARGITAERVQAIAAGTPLGSREALEAGLVDAVGYRDEVYARERERASEDTELLYLNSYLARSPGPEAGSPVVALIYGVGNVVQGKSRFDPITGLTFMGSDSVTAAFRQAMRDEEVRAIVFRIDSGGGSAVASQLMWRETLQAREQGKPVIATMSDVAGSGGYYIAMGADRIVAQPGTITGSIGVVFGKFLTRKFWDELGITFDEVRTHPNASMWNGIRDFTPEQWEYFQSFLDRLYAIFMEGVAEGRGLPIEKVREIAKGRIWTGSDALELGLVDELGGLPVAVRLAKEAAGIDEDTAVELRLFPRPKTPARLLIEQISGKQPSNSEQASTAALAGTLEQLQPLGRLAARLGLIGVPGELELDLPQP
jgi:protease-4